MNREFTRREALRAGAMGGAALGGLTIFAQPGYPGGYDGGHLYPFHLDSYNNGECTNDIDHTWAPQHTFWDSGQLDAFVSGHMSVDGPSNGSLTMGYYTRKDLSVPFIASGSA